MAMRTTLDIEDDVLTATKELARQQRKSAGQVLSELARQALTQGTAPRAAAPEACYGFRPFAARGVVVSNETIDRIRGEEGL